MGKRLKDMGYTRGWADIFIPKASNGYHGLFIEFKSAKGKVDKEYQVPLLEQLSNDGYKTVVCRSAEEAIEVVKNYLKK